MLNDIKVNVEENWVKTPFLRLSVPYIRKNVPKKDQALFLMCYQNIEDERRKAGMTNRVLGYVCGFLYVIFLGGLILLIRCLGFGGKRMVLPYRMKSIL